MDRRRFIARAGVILGVPFAGCSTGGDDPSATLSMTQHSSSETNEDPQTTTEAESATPATSTPSSATKAESVTPATPKPYPDRPEELTPESVRQYAEEHAHIRKYNWMIRTYGSDVESFGLDCFGAYATAGQEGHYAFVHCTGSANYPDLHADFGVYQLYFVSHQTTTHVNANQEFRDVACANAIIADDPTKNVHSCEEGSGVAYRVFNLHQSAHTVDVSVEFLGDTHEQTDSVSDRTVTRTYSLDSHASVHQDRVGFREGTYRLIATLDSDTQTAYEWEFHAPKSMYDHTVSVIVTPARQIMITDPPDPGD